MAGEEVALFEENMGDNDVTAAAGDSSVNATTRKHKSFNNCWMQPVMNFPPRQVKTHKCPVFNAAAVAAARRRCFWYPENAIQTVLWGIKAKSGRGFVWSYKLSFEAATGLSVVGDQAEVQGLLED